MIPTQKRMLIESGLALGIGLLTPLAFIALVELAVQGREDKQSCNDLTRYYVSKCHRYYEDDKAAAGCVGAIKRNVPVTGPECGRTLGLVMKRERK